MQFHLTKKLFFITLMLLICMPLPAWATVYTYDNLGRLDTVTYDNGQTLTYHYDAGGNLLKVSSKDSIAPIVISNIPAKDETSVLVNQPITITFSEPIVEDTAFTSITVKNGTDTVITTNVINGNTLTITSGTNLSNNTTYTVTIPSQAVQDKAGNKLAAEYSFSFTTQN